MSKLVRISDIINDCNLGLCVPTCTGESLASILKKICDQIGTGTGDGTGGCCYDFVNSPTILFTKDGNTVSAAAITMTEFDAGNLAPLFTTNVSTPTTTPFLSFNLNQQDAHEVFIGPLSGTDYPSFRLLDISDMPFSVGDFIQNQFSTDQLANWRVTGHGQLGDYLQISTTSRLVTDFTGTLSITEPTNSDTGDDLRLSKLKFFVQTADVGFDPRQQVANAEIYSADGQHLNLLSPGSVTIQSHSIDFGDGLGVPFFSVGGFNPLIITAGDSGTGSDGVAEFFKNNVASINAVTNIGISVNRENGIALNPSSNRGTRQAFATIGIQAVDVTQTGYKGDLTLNTVDATVNSGVPTEYIRLKYDGRIIASRYSTLLTAPATTGVKHMLTCDENGLFSHEVISAGGAGSVTSVDLQMPSGFIVSNNPITTAGTIIVTGAGTTDDYIRGDGSIAPLLIPISSLINAVANNTLQASNTTQTWNWSPVPTNSSGLILSGSGAISGGNISSVLKVSYSGGNIGSVVEGRAIHAESTKTGTTSTNTAIYAKASGATTNYAIRGEGHVRLGAIGNASEIQFITNSGSLITIKPPNTGAYTLTLPLDDGNANQALVTNGSGILSWSNNVGIPLSSILAAAGTNTIDSGAHPQTWKWDTLSSGSSAFTFSSGSSTVTNGTTLLDVRLSNGNTIDGAITNALNIGNTKSNTTGTNTGINIVASGGLNNYAIYAATGDVIIGNGGLRQNGGDVFFQSLSYDTNQDFMVGWRQSTGEINKVGIGAGLQLVGSVLSATAVAGTPTWQDTLTASSTLSGNNTIAGGGFDFTWNNVDDYTISSTKLFLKVANFGAATPGDVVTLVSTTTGEITFSAPGAGSSGTVTSFSAGDLATFFTTSEATVTTTPALTFAFVNAGAHTYWGNNTGGATTPAYISNAAFVRVNDTNVTMTLTGSPTTALLETMTATLGWTGTLGVARGGTNLASYTIGDTVFASGATTISKLAIGTANQLLRVNAGATAPEWFTPTFGTVTDFSAGDLSPLFTTIETTTTSTPALSFVLTNAGANTYFGNATGGATSPSYTAAGALTTVSDTNIILTPGGNSATSLLRAASITATWNGTLGVARGGTNLASYTVGDILIASGATSLNKIGIGGPGQQLRVNAGGTSLEYFTAGAGITSLNALTPVAQFMVVGTAGTDFNISSVTDTHTFNIPSAGLGITRGLVTNAAQTIGDGIKTFNIGVVINESGANTAAGGDFRVESDTNINAIIVDSTNNRVGILGVPGAFGFDIAAVSTRIQGNLGVGTSPSGSVALTIGGSAWTAFGLDTTGISISPGIGANAALANFAGTLIESTSGTHSVLASIFVNAFTTTPGAAGATDAATVWIAGAPSTVGATLSSLVVNSGTSRFRGDVQFGTSSNVLMVTANAYTAGGRDSLVRNQATGRFEVVDPDVVVLGSSALTSVTPVLADKGTYMTLSNASPITFNVPTNASVAYPIGTTITLEQGLAGQITISPAGGVTVNASDAALKSRVQFSVMTLVKKATNTWTLSGDTTV